MKLQNLDDVFERRILRTPDCQSLMLIYDGKGFFGRIINLDYLTCESVCLWNAIINSIVRLDSDALRMDSLQAGQKSPTTAGMVVDSPLYEYCMSRVSCINSG